MSRSVQHGFFELIMEKHLSRGKHHLPGFGPRWIVLEPFETLLGFGDQPAVAGQQCKGALTMLGCAQKFPRAAQLQILAGDLKAVVGGA